MNSRAKGKRAWKPINSLNGLYEASDDGLIRSVCRETTSGRILKPYVNKKNGYVYVGVSVGNKRKTIRLHRLVAEAFLGEPNGRQVNHIDGNKQNNAPSNLEYCTQSENMIHAYEIGLEKRIGKRVIDLDTLEVFETITDAAVSAGGKQATMVYRVCEGMRSHYRNRRFAYYADYLNGAIPEYKGKVKRKASVSLWR